MPVLNTNEKRRRAAITRRNAEDLKFAALDATRRAAPPAPITLDPTTANPTTAKPYARQH